MNRAKKLLPYGGLPVLCCALLLLKWRELSPAALLLRELLVVFGYLAALSDLRKRVVPNRLAALMLGAWALVIVPQLFLRTEDGLRLLLSGAVGALLAGVVFLTVYLVSRRGLGGGDVKLMAASGLYLGFNGVLPAMLYGSVLAALAALALILLKKIKPKDAIPLAPFLYVGMLLTMLIR